MEILETAPEDVRAFAAGEAGTVKVGIFSASNVVVDAITAYRASFPAVNFRITQDEFESACDITVSTVMPSSSNARGEGIAVGEGTLFRERIGIAVPESSSFGDVVSLDELADEPFVCLAGSRRLREVCDALCAGRAFHPRIGFESDNPAVVRKVIGLGLGVGFWPTCSWEALGDGSARLARLAEEEFERTIAPDARIARARRRRSFRLLPVSRRLREKPLVGRDGETTNDAVVPIGSMRTR